MTPTQEGNTASLLLDRVTRLVEVERSLTEAIEEAQPWLSGGTGTARPLPSSMDEVHNVLHLGRNLASRTSAPAGWNPYAPVIGFTTPNPLPHQLRGGSLGGLQLEMARKLQQEEKMAVLEKKREREEAKRKEETQSSNVHTPQSAKRPATAARMVSTSKQQQRPRQPVKMADMNLSDSDSSSDEDESEEDE